MEIDIQNSKVKSVEINSNMFPLESDMFSNIKCEISSETALIVKKEIPENDFSSEFEKNEVQRIDVEKQSLPQQSEPEKQIKKVYDCQICGKSFVYKYNLKNHTKAVHDKTEICECKTCGKNFSTKSNLYKQFMIKQKLMIVILVEKLFLTNIP